jgi:hypothetical protein
MAEKSQLKCSLVKKGIQKGIKVKIQKFSFLSILLLLNGCSIFFSAPKELDFSAFDRIGSNETQSLYAKLGYPVPELQGASSAYKAVIQDGLNKQQGKQVVIFKRPDKLRINIFATNLNQLTAYFVCSEKKIYGYDASEKKQYIGTATRENIERLINIPFSTEEVMLWLAGRMFPISDSNVLQKQLFVDKKSDRIGGKLLLRDGRIIHFFLHHAPASANQLLLDSLEVRRTVSDEVIFTSTNSWLEEDYKSVFPVPSKIEFSLPQDSLSGTLNKEEFHINPEFNQSLMRVFEYSIKSSIPVERID